MLSILIIDDDALTRDTLHSVLQKCFFHNICTASNAAHAIKIIKEKNIDVVLMDIRLPDIGGMELLQTVKSFNPDIEVIIITGYGSQDIAIQSLHKGAIDYIEKPIRLENLLAAIGRAEEKLVIKNKLRTMNRILVVNDNHEETSGLEVAINQYGYEVVKACNAGDAYSRLESDKIDILLTVLNLKDGNGLEILRQAKKIQAHLEGIVIIDSMENGQLLEALHSGAFNCICKPVNFSILEIIISNAIEKIKLRMDALYRNRELQITSEIITKANEQLEKRIEERTQELLKTQAQLFQTSKLVTLGEMSAGLAHELNQPLGAIALTTKYLSKILDTNRLENNDLLKAIHDIDLSIKRMTSVIHHIRTFARQDTLKFVEVDINETINAALDLIGEQLRLHEINVTKDLAVGLPSIAGEPFQLEQVWLNLLANARDAVEEKALNYKKTNPDSVSEPFKKSLQICTAFKEKKVVLSISDNGTGMTPEVKAKIFEPFFTTKEVGRAMGLGMAISYGIVESHKGKIELESEEGDGTTIRVLFDPFREKACQRF